MQHCIPLAAAVRWCMVYTKRRLSKTKTTQQLLFPIKPDWACFKVAAQPENTSGHSNLITGRIAAAHERFSNICQVAPVWPPPNTCFLWLTQVQIPNDISIGSAAFAPTHGRELLYFTISRPFSALKLLIPIGGSGLPSNTWFLQSTRFLNPNGISIGAAVFAGHTTVTDRQCDWQTKLLSL